ncbi:hypothetical protein ACP4OV_019524 [Aristida adscensionis]
MGNCLKLHRAASWVDDDEWEAAGEEAGATAAAAGEKMERVEVRIKVTRRQLQELLEKKAGGKRQGRQLEEVLAELMSSGTVCYRQPEEMKTHWRPALYSIPEAADES